MRYHAISLLDKLQIPLCIFLSPIRTIEVSNKPITYKVCLFRVGWQQAGIRSQINTHVCQPDNMQWYVYQINLYLTFHYSMLLDRIQNI